MKTSDLIVIILTFVLFILALFVKGLTKDILLEAGVLLVSVKIIMMARQQYTINSEILKKLDNISKKQEGCD
jgi:cell division protein FtsL